MEFHEWDGWPPHCKKCKRLARCWTPGSEEASQETQWRNVPKQDCPGKKEEIVV